MEPAAVDASDRRSLGRFLAPLDAFVCAVPYALLLPFTRAAIAAGTGMVDMGGHTDTVLAQLAMHPEARQAGVAVVPDCGMGPGMNNTLGLYAMELLRAGGSPRAGSTCGTAVCPRTAPGRGATGSASTSRA